MKFQLFQNAWGAYELYIFEKEGVRQIGFEYDRSAVFTSCSRLKKYGNFPFPYLQGEPAKEYYDDIIKQKESGEAVLLVDETFGAYKVEEILFPTARETFQNDETYAAFEVGKKIGYEEDNEKLIKKAEEVIKEYMKCDKSKNAPLDIWESMRSESRK